MGNSWGFPAIPPLQFEFVLVLVAVDLLFTQDLTQDLDVQRDCVIDVAYGPRLSQS